MQIIEHSIIGTRSAVIRMKRRDTALEVLLFPMMHVASPTFYQAVTARLRKCDLLVVEGVGPSALTWAITASYRILPLRKKSGLVAQDIRYKELGVPLINPDMTADEFTDGWRAMPLKARLLMWLIFPVVSVMQLLGGTQRLLSPDVEVSDLPSALDEALTDDETMQAVLGLMVDQRDARLLDALADIIRARAHEPITVAVVCGAGHMPAVVNGLRDRHGYKTRSGEWLTVLAA